MGMERTFVLAAAGSAAIAIAAGGAGCVAQAPGRMPPPAALAGIPWPPPDTPAREASDDVISLLGKQFSSKGGNTAVIGDNLDFSTRPSLPWAIYTLPGFRPEVEIGGVGASFTLTEGTPGDGTALYVGVSNYTRGTWEWYAAAPSDWNQVLTNGKDYRSTDGKVSIAVLLWRGGSASVSEVRFTRVGQTTLTAPQGLAATANVGRINLDWQDVPGAVDYDVYRATEPDFASPTKVNTTPVLSSEYSDAAVLQNTMYYYKVTAVAGPKESPMSNMVDIYSPQYDLPPPPNTRVVGTVPGAATVAWDYYYEGTPSFGFEIFVSTTPSFSLNQLWKPSLKVNSSARSLRVPGLLDGRTYYWRVCAYYKSGTQGDLRGRLTDDCPLVGLQPWEELTVEGGINGYRSYCSLAVVNGNPAVSYYDGNDHDLKYIRATNANGTAWGSPETIDTGGIEVGRYSSLAEVNGNPAISYGTYYYDFVNDVSELRFSRAVDQDGTAWGTPLTVDGPAISSDYANDRCSLTMTNGKPAIAYQCGADIRYVRATSASGTAWGTVETIDSSGDYGSGNSLAIVSGNPAVCYERMSGLTFIRATDANGTAWGAPLTIDASSCWDASLAVVSGNPAISYYDSTNDDLKYVRATNANGTAWDAPQTIDSSCDVGEGTSLAVISGNPAVAYVAGNGLALAELRYARATTPDGSAVWNPPETVDMEYIHHPSLAEVSGQPAISYIGSSNYDLKYARCF